MNRNCRSSLLRCWSISLGKVLAFSVLTAAPLWGETWTDNTGNFKVSAEFVRLERDKIVLKKTNGVTIEVPLRRLSPASQELAKRLSSRTAFPATDAPTKETPSVSQPQALDAYVRELLVSFEDGDYQRVWNAFPPGFQKDMQDVLHSFAENMDHELWGQYTGLLKKAAQVLKDKQQFILGHPKLATNRDAFTKSLPTIADAVEAVANCELTDLQKLKTIELQKFFKGDGRKVFAKIKAASDASKELQKLAPVPGAILGPNADNPFALVEINSSTVKFTLVKQERDSGILMTEFMGKSFQEEWVKIDGCWLPKSFVDGWQPQITQIKHWFAGDMKQTVEGLKVHMGIMQAPINQLLDQLLAAQSQDQFNMVIDNVQKQFGAGPDGAPAFDP